MKLPAIAISYTQQVPVSVFAEFNRLLSSGGVHVESEERDGDGPYAGLEWLVPTVVIIFLGKAYFDGFLKEMGKDHYALLKQGLKSLYARLVGPEAPKVTVLSTAGKASGAQKYSLLFSLLAEAEDGLRFKLLIQSAASEAEYEAAVNAFIAFLDAFHRRQLSAEVVNELRNTKVSGKTVLLAYKPELGRVSPIDPLAGREREA
jgi:hypothetical protein